jgi:hypothetical protein
MSFSPAETLHRLVKEAVDSGQAESLQAAEALFQGYRLALHIDATAVSSPAHQSALLTAVNLARRVFLGGVDVVGPLETSLLSPLPLGGTLAEAVTRLGGRVSSTVKAGTPVIRIGGVKTERGPGFEVRTVWRAWRGGIVPAYADLTDNDEAAMPLAPMLAAAFAVSEAFFHVRGGAPIAGRRPVGLSLWAPGASDTFDGGDDGPRLERLPAALWLIGLGHLGQAYLWALGLLPYADPSSLHLVLQDMDLITPSTESTSILTEANMVGRMKTRAMGDWAAQRGFSTRLVERYFDAGFRRRDDEPAVALCGLDNGLGRRALDKVGFDLVVEAGLGRGHRDFHALRVHTLPSSRSADQLWPVVAEGEDLTGRVGYRKLLADGVLDQCGVTLLAGKAVGAPFVGAVAACLAISELLRLLHGGPLHHVIDLNLMSPGHQQVVLNAQDFSGFNPGFTALREAGR